MARNTSILLGSYFENFINEQVQSGRFSSTSEVIRTALRLFEIQDIKVKKLNEELKAGEESGLISNFNREERLIELHSKYVCK